MENEDRSEISQPDQRMQVLLCHSEADTARAEEFRQMLERNGIPCAPESAQDLLDCGDAIDALGAVLDCGCVLVLVSEQAESCRKIDAAIGISLSYDVPLGFAYLEDCAFTALPVDNADRIPVCRDGAEEIHVLLQYLQAACDGRLAVQYEEESFGSETVKNRVTCWGDTCTGAMALGWGPVPLLGPAIIAIIAFVLALLIRSRIAQIVTVLLQKAGFMIP